MLFEQQFDNRKVLIIDDSELIHEDFKTVFSLPSDTVELDELESKFLATVKTTPVPQCFEINSAFQGKEGWEMVKRAKLSNQPYALAFVDARMPPGWDGTETIRHLWEIDPCLQIVMCTAYSDYTWAETVEKLGLSDRLLILKKPFDSVEVIQMASSLTSKWNLAKIAQLKMDKLEELVLSRTLELSSQKEQLEQNLHQLKQTRQLLVQSEKMSAIGLLAAGIAHDFNNLLQGINGYSALALRKLNPDERVYKNIMEVKNAGERAADLTKQLLAFGRKQVLKATILNLNDVLLDMQNMLRRVIREDVELVFNLEQDLGLVKADSSQIYQVILNLAINAMDAMPSGGTIFIETKNIDRQQDEISQDSDCPPGCYVLLCVTDTGTGLDHETRPHIFEPFFTTKKKGMGTGMGLATVFGIVKQSAVILR